ncbi:hypothetical protein SAICODRAFT_73974 [Saitoella complicata NRRL Y-17804]|uniref:uncharacterized protein n=1 Tax=Saitoella complicata (strain BCRC 22490 / CBS 7301 / JCM 7358 / NBRC 10748 / NRRL Y-17804) TaxID=698492 RepID=UPI0008668BA3|nr:uncharacterized protein SAICODRAFT_73974 [Saitoella complicata NRRL Y-17804]ODQ49667.1 hypothetical protein SAICODRAFT_73974 [Saitoella complicata NRRL Y-17804]
MPSFSSASKLMSCVHSPVLLAETEPTITVLQAEPMNAELSFAMLQPVLPTLNNGVSRLSWGQFEVVIDSSRATLTGNSTILAEAFAWELAFEALAFGGGHYDSVPIYNGTNIHAQSTTIPSSSCPLFLL